MRVGCDQVKIVLTDPFGVQVRLDDDVFYAGTDHNRKPTINRGRVEAINIAERKICVLRSARSGHNIADSSQRRTWVDISKVGVILP